MLSISRQDDSLEHHLYTKLNLYYLLQVEKKAAIHIYFDISSARSFAPLIYKLRFNM